MSQKIPHKHWEINNWFKIHTRHHPENALLLMLRLFLSYSSSFRSYSFWSCERAIRSSPISLSSWLCCRRSEFLSMFLAFCLASLLASLTICRFPKGLIPRSLIRRKWSNSAGKICRYRPAVCRKRRVRPPFFVVPFLVPSCSYCLGFSGGLPRPVYRRIALPTCLQSLWW